MSTDIKLTTAQTARFNDLARMFGAERWAVEKDACTGDYRGHYDYSVRFHGVGRLYLGIDRRGMENGTVEALKTIRHFRAHQEQNSEKITAILKEEFPAISAASVDVIPNEYASSDLCVWAALRLTVYGVEVPYRETWLHYCLTHEDDGSGKYDVEKRVRELVHSIKSRVEQAA